jgi:hypothetical protein
VAQKPTSLSVSNPPQTEDVDVFLNIPYDRDFVELFLAYIAGLAALGLTPHATIEIPGGERRLDRIFSLVRACRYSVHDLSRVELDVRRPKTPRFNMPLELGLAIAWQKLNPGVHDWFLFEAVRRRIEKSLSDLKGTDPYIHSGRASGLFRELRNAFMRPRRRATVGQMQLVHEGLKEALPGIMKDAGTKSPFSAQVFDELRVLAAKLGDVHVPARDSKK